MKNKQATFSRVLSAIFIAVIMLSLLSACQTPEENNENANNNQGTISADAEINENAGEIAEEDPYAKYDDDLGEYDFNGEDFKIQTWLNENINNHIDTEEETGELFNDALYTRNRIIEERFNVVIKQLLVPDFANARTRRTILAGDSDAFDMIIERGPDGLKNWQDDLVFSLEDIPHVDLSKPYWNQSANKTLTLGGNQYVAISDFCFSTYELSRAVLFNKGMVQDFGFENLYDLVSSGKWTFDKMEDMMKQVIFDLNGDGVMDRNDRYGYVAHPKQVLPNFWIAADVFSVGKDGNDIPYLSMGSEKFFNVFERIFEIMWDSGTYYMGGEGAVIPQWAIDMFSNEQSLFLDTTFFVIEQMRGKETDFGILPYPKFNEQQEQYVSRIEYYMAVQIPIINSHVERAGVMLEALSSYSAKTIIPAYYEIALKTKYARDDDSAQMLDLIMETLVVDIGDTTLCDQIRDGFLAAMFQNNNRNLASRLESTERIIEIFIERIPG